MKQTIFFDSIYSINNGNPFDASFSLTSNLKNVKKISLKSIEMPIAFTNVRTGLNDFTIRMLSVNYTVYLNSSVYTSATTLCSDLTTAFNSNSIPVKPVFSVVGNKIRITMTGSNLYSVIGSNFSRYVLGFINNQTSNPALGANSTITAEYNFLLNVDNYVNIYLENIPQSMTTSNNLFSSFKVPLNAVNNVVYFFGDESNFNQSIDLTDENAVISQIKIKIMDRFGNVLNNNGVDYSFSLQFL